MRPPISINPTDEEMARILATPGELTEEEMNMTEAEFRARIQLMKEQAAATRIEAEELEAYMAKKFSATNDNEVSK